MRFRRDLVALAFLAAVFTLALILVSLAVHGRVIW